MHARFATLSFAALAALAAAQAPDGFRTHDDPALGLRFYYPEAFREIPLEPTETVSRVKYVRSGRFAPANKVDPPGPVTDLAWFEVFVVEREAADAKEAEKPANPFLPKGLAEAEAATRPSDPTAGAKNLREAMLAMNRVRDFEEFKRKKLGGWRLAPIGLGSPELREWTLISTAQPTPAPHGAVKMFGAGYCAIKEAGDVTLGVYGVTREGEPKDFEAALRRTLRSLKVVDGGAAEADLERIYAGKKWSDVPRRVEIRRGLARGWRATDTENFVLVHHTPNDRMIAKTARDVEAIRPFYMKLFPPVKPVEAVAIVRVCRDLKEYMTYGAPPGSGGFFHPGNEELVLFDYLQTEQSKERTTGRRLTDKDSMIVLYHEAFHQYIHYAVGEIAPHDWFNEGHGDYFSGAEVSESGRVMRIGPSPWRVGHAKAMAADKVRGWVPAAKLVRASRAEYYNPAVVGNYYACGWALVYFLREAPASVRRPEWDAILGTYFDVLKTEYSASLKALGPEASLAAKGEAGAVARETAVRAAFEDVDFAAFEAAWKGWIAKLPGG